MTRLLIIAAIVAALAAPTTAQAYPQFAQCSPTIYQQGPTFTGVFFVPDTSTPSQVATGYYFICTDVTVENQVSVSFSGCPGIRSELQGVVAADDCYIGAADPYYGGADTYTILDSETYCNDNLLAHKQHFGAGTVYWYERETSTGLWFGPFHYDLMSTWYNGPAYNRRCGVA